MHRISADGLFASEACAVYENGQRVVSDGAALGKEKQKLVGAYASSEARGGGGLGQAQSQIAMSKLPPQRRLRESLFWSAVVIAGTALAAVVLWAVTGWLWLVVHEGRIGRLFCRA